METGTHAVTGVEVRPHEAGAFNRWSRVGPGSPPGVGLLSSCVFTKADGESVFSWVHWQVRDAGLMAGYFDLNPQRATSLLGKLEQATKVVEDGPVALQPRHAPLGRQVELNLERCERFWRHHPDATTGACPSGFCTGSLPPLKVRGPHPWQGGNEKGRRGDDDLPLSAMISSVGSSEKLRSSPKCCRLTVQESIQPQSVPGR